MIKKILVLVMVLFLVGCGVQDVSEPVQTGYDEDDVELSDVEVSDSEDVLDQMASEDVVDEVTVDPKQKEALDLINEIKVEYKEKRKSLNEIRNDDDAEDLANTLKGVKDFIVEAEKSYDKEDYGSAIKYAGLAKKFMN